MSLFICEIKKIFQNKIFLVIFLCCIFLNGGKIYDFKSGRDELLDKIYSKYEGRIDKTLIREMKGRINELEEEITEGDREESVTSPPNYDKYILGNMYGDYNYLNEIYGNLEYCVKYNSYIHEHTKKAKENMEFLSDSDTYERQYNENFIKQYDNRSIDWFYDTSGWNNYVGYAFSVLCVLIIIVCGCVNIFSDEREKKNSTLLLTCRFGRKKLTVIKLLAISFTAVVVQLVFSLEDLLMFLRYDSLSNGSAPIYSMPEYDMTPLNCTFIQYIFIMTGIKILVSIMIALLCALMSSIFDNNIKSCVVTLGVIIAWIFVGNKLTIGNLNNMYEPIKLFQSYNYMDFCGNAVSIATLNILVIIITSIILFIGAYLLETKVRRKYV